MIPPPPSCRPCTRSGRCCFGDAPPPPLGQGVPPLHLLQAVRKERALLRGGCPPFPFLSMGSSPISLLQSMHWELVLLIGGCPPPPPSPVYTLGEPAAWSGCPPLSPTHQHTLPVHS